MFIRLGYIRIVWESKVRLGDVPTSDFEDSWNLETSTYAKTEKCILERLFRDSNMTKRVAIIMPKLEYHT